MSGLLAEGLGGLHFLRPAWLLLWPLLLVGLLLLRRRRQRSPWNGLVDAHLLPHLLAPSRGRRARWRGLLAPLAASLFCLALAGPAWREIPQPQMGREAGLVIVLDLSDGMRASDTPPNRLQRARYKIADLLRARRDGQTALVAYAGDAFTVAPLTDDARTLEALLGALEPEVMPVAGQRLARALAMAAELLRGAGYPAGDVLVLSYRAAAEDIAAAARLADDGIRVSVLALGDEVGAPVALPQGGFLRDDAGQLLLPRRDLDSLEQLAAASGGRVVAARNDGSDIGELLAHIDSAEGEGRIRDERGGLRHADEGPWLVLLLLPLALLLIRRAPGLLVLLLVAGLAPRPALALEWAALWQRPDQRAWQALGEQRYAEARAMAESPALRGAAAYREGDFAAAAEAFAQGGAARDLYNRGTALAQAGKLEEALAALDAALAADPSLADARHNREVVQQALARQQSPPPPASGESGSEGGEAQQEQGEQGEQPPSEQPGEQSGQPGEPQGQQGEQGEPQAGSEDDPAAASDAEQAGAEQREAMEQALREAEAEGEAAEGEGKAAPPLDTATAEKQQAAEQWLRRIPDDPGGLLRRKFALEHRRRVLEGQP
jgi:Ca-activated chloride channel homolog